MPLFIAYVIGFAIASVAAYFHETEGGGTSTVNSDTDFVEAILMATMVAIFWPLFIIPLCLVPVVRRFRG